MTAEPGGQPYGQRRASPAYAADQTSGSTFRVLQETLQFLDCQASVRENPAQRSLGHIATLMYRDRRSATIGMTHDVVTAGYPGHLEPMSF